MLHKTNFISDVDFEAEITDISYCNDSLNLFEKLNYGPYLPIQSGSYNIKAISTSDFNSYNVIEHKEITY